MYGGVNMEKVLNVTGMHCKSCELLLIDILSELPGISNISIDHKKGTVRFVYTDENVISQVKKAILAEGYTESTK